jgi:hypothetical protein
MYMIHVFHFNVINNCYCLQYLEKVFHVVYEK